MKLFKIHIYLVLIASLGIFSCEKDGDKIVVKPETASQLSSSTNSIVLTMANSDEEALSLSWSSAEFGYNAAIKYSLELDKKGNNFAKPKVITFDSTYSKVFTVAELNEIALAQGLPQGTPGQLEVRLVSSVSSLVESLVSNVVELTVTPYVSEPPYKTIYMVGDAAEFDWDAGSATPVFRSDTDPFEYTFTGYFDQGQLKFLGFLNQWAPMWGTNANNELVFRETLTDADPWAFYIPAADYYTIKVNLLTNTYSQVSYTETIPAPYDPVSITGDFNGWGAAAMTSTPKNPHIWTMEYTFASAAEFKFRNNDWSKQWGPTKERTRLYGKAEPAGNDDKVKVEAGTYKITFNDLTGNYLLIKK
jgi:starch-binding outer membrane protein SusE/F